MSKHEVVFGRYHQNTRASLDEFHCWEIRTEWGGLSYSLKFNGSSGDVEAKLILHEKKSEESLHHSKYDRVNYQCRLVNGATCLETFHNDRAEDIRATVIDKARAVLSARPVLELLETEYRCLVGADE